MWTVFSNAESKGETEALTHCLECPIGYSNVLFKLNDALLNSKINHLGSA